MVLHWHAGIGKPLNDFLGEGSTVSGEDGFFSCTATLIAEKNGIFNCLHNAWHFSEGSLEKNLSNKVIKNYYLVKTHNSFIYPSL